MADCDCACHNEWFFTQCPDGCGCRWPDGEPVTPWADPWHDILGDIRALHDANPPQTWDVTGP